MWQIIGKKIDMTNTGKFGHKKYMFHLTKFEKRYKATIEVISNF